MGLPAAAALLALVLAQAPAALTAQADSGAAKPAPRNRGAEPGEKRLVRGRVMRGGSGAARPLGGAWVVLHRVGSERAAPLDSQRTDGAGRYAFSYRTSGEPQAVYFASSSHAGIAYFTPPFTLREVSGTESEIVVFDTTSARVPIRVRARHVVISAPAEGRRRTVMEIYELSNDSSVTRVVSNAKGTVWESELLEGARDAQVGRADFSDGAVSIVQGRARLSAPFAPGLKQISYSYTVPPGHEYEVRAAAATDLLEVLVEDGLGRAEGAGLVAAGPTAVSGRTFARFLAQDVAEGSRARINAPGAGAASRDQIRVLAIMTALGAVLLVGLARAMMRRPRRAHAAASDSSVLRAQLAAHDEKFAAIEHATAEQRADHYEERARLSQRLTDAVAREQGLK